MLQAGSGAEKDSRRLGERNVFLTGPLRAEVNSSKSDAARKIPKTLDQPIPYSAHSPPGRCAGPPVPPSPGCELLTFICISELAYVLSPHIILFRCHSSMLVALMEKLLLD